MGRDPLSVILSSPCPFKLPSGWGCIVKWCLRRSYLLYLVGHYLITSVSVILLHFLFSCELFFSLSLCVCPCLSFFLFPDQSCTFFSSLLFNYWKYWIILRRNIPPHTLSSCGYLMTKLPLNHPWPCKIKQKINIEFSIAIIRIQWYKCQ